MTIRHARPGDLEAIAALEGRCYPAAEAASPERMAGRLAAFPDHFWLLEEKGELLSFVSALASSSPVLTDEMFADPALHDPEGAYLMLLSVATDPGHRGRGCAGALVRRALSDARSAGRLGAVLTCKERLIPFYARFGFGDEGISCSEHGGAVWHQMSLRFSREEGL